MGLRNKLVELLSRGTSPEADPDELVPLETVPLTSGPVAVETLQEAGIEASFVETFNAATALSAAQIMVPRCQVAAANDVLHPPG